MATKVIGIECGYSALLVEIPYSDKTETKSGDEIIFKDEEGNEEHGVVKYLNKDPKDEEKILFTSKILRRATANDLQRVESHIEQARRALDTSKEIIKRLALEMNVFRVGYSFDGSKVHFTFTAEERVDFRDLVKDLAKILKKQIHLRQIGPRDKASIIGGYGRCGRKLCCSGFLNKLESINMEMVRAQGLESKGSSKLSGACGKLLCCLKYEIETYRELKRGVPEVGSIIRLKKSASSSKEAYVMSADILNQKLKIKLYDKDEFLIINADEIDKVIKQPKENIS